MLSIAGKKIVLTMHIILVSIWLGTTITILTLLFMKNSLSPVSNINVIDKSIFFLFDTIVMNVSIAVALTGLVFSMFTKWGFLKFYWISIKWIILLILATVIMLFAGPVVNGMAALSDIFMDQARFNKEYHNYEYYTIVYTIVQILLLICVIYISVVKPWGQRKIKRELNRKIVIASGVIIGIFLIVAIISQYTQLKYYRNMPINDVDLNSLNDGSYQATVDYYFPYEVEVIITEHRIKDIIIIKNRENHYAKLAEGVRNKILREQKFNIDAVTGATTTSKVLLKAIEKALISE